VVSFTYVIARETGTAELLAVAKGSLGYFLAMPKHDSAYAPDEQWLKPLRDAIAKYK